MNTLTAQRTRRRLWYGMAVVTAVLLGLASRRYPGGLAALFGKYPGDVLWAMMVFFGWGLARSNLSTMRIATLAFATCATVEALKLYRAPWIIHVRNTTLGALVFGHAFSWQNLVAYAGGIVLAGAIEALWLARNSA